MESDIRTKIRGILKEILNGRIPGYRGYKRPEAWGAFPRWADCGVQGVQASRGGGRVSRVGRRGVHFLGGRIGGYRGFNRPEAGVVFPGWADSGE